MEGMTMTHTITAALASSARREDDMLRRDFLKTATATAVLTATLPVQAKEPPAMSNANFADVNGQHIFYSVQGAGKPLIHSSRGRQPRQLREQSGRTGQGPAGDRRPSSGAWAARQTPTGHCAVNRWATTLPL